MTYEKYTELIGKQVTNFLNKFRYDGEENIDKFWERVCTAEEKWFQFYLNTPYAMATSELITGIHGVIENIVLNTKKDL